MSTPLTPEQRLAALQKDLGTAVGSDFPNLNPSPSPAPTTTLSDDKTSAAPPSATQTNTNQPSLTFTPAPNVLRNYASYSPLLSLLVTNTQNYNKLVANQKFYPEDWDTICKSGGVGPNKAQGFSGGTTSYFSRDMYIDNATVTTVVGMSQENRGSNATEIELMIVEPLGMDFVEQLYDYCNVALGESNYCQLPYLLKIEFKGYRDDGTNETVPYATKYIPIHLITMDIKVNNLGAIYKVQAVAFNELGVTEQYGRIPSVLSGSGNSPAPLILGTELALAQAKGLDAKTQQQIANGVISPTVAQNVGNQANSAVASGTAGIAPIGSGGVLHEITSAFAGVLNNVQNTLLNNGTIAVPDQYTITYSDVPDKNGSTDIGQYLFLDTATLSGENVPTVARDVPMGAPAVTEAKPIDVSVAGRNMLKYAVDPATGQTGSGAVTYTSAHLITFNSGSSIVDCLNTLIINSNYIVAQINRYNGFVDQINQTAQSLNLQAGSPIPPSLQSQLDLLNNTPLNWFVVVPTVKILAYDSKRGTYARSINYNIQPYKVYNTRSISAPNGNPIAENRVVKEYDYIFTGNNTEILSFDLNFNTAFLTYSQFNHDTKIQGSGAGMPAYAQQSVPQNSLETVSSPISDGRQIKPVSSSTKNAQGIGAITPERNQAADIAATIYGVAEQIQLDISVYCDPDYIRQDGVFINPISSSAYITPSATSVVQGILFNSGEVYANVNFKIPSDINLDSGVLDLAFQGDAVNYRRNVFSGQYRVLTVINKFDKALFTQQLNLVRFDDSHNMTVNTNQSKTQNTNQTSQATPATTQAPELKTPTPPSPPPVKVSFDTVIAGKTVQMGGTL
jgi:hypothetical protein